MDTAQARRWCRQQKYDQVAAMYARQIAAMDAWGPWDYYYYAYSLSKLKEYSFGTYNLYLREEDDNATYDIVRQNNDSDHVVPSG